MKTKETSKSKFVYPDKLYAKCNNNKTLDMSYAPQDMEAVEYIRTDTFINKALAYLNEKFYFNNLHHTIENNTYNCMEEMFEDFENYMNT